jgi:RHS repeat-associated protein
LYQGKELQDELGLEIYDFHARGYDPMLGRTWQTDPMSEMFYDHSPYSWVKNNPLLRIDPTGMTDFTFDKKTGDVTQVGEANDEPDRILRTNRKGEVKYKKNGEAKVAMGGIEQGILADGQNWKTDDQVIEVGGEGQASVDGVKSFTMGLSEYLGKEIKGFSYSSNASGNVTDMVLGKYLNNSNTESYGSVRELALKYGVDFSRNNILQEFHTHPDGKLGATQSAPNLSQDVTSLQSGKSYAPNASFIILYRILGQKKPGEYDYTHEYRPKRK